MTELLATVVIPCLDSAALLADCLRAVNEQTIRERLRTVVVDNLSVDDSVAVARELADDVLVTGDRGPSGPRNRGLRASSTPLILSLDADCLPARDWAEVHLASIEIASANVLATAGLTKPRARANDWWGLRNEITPRPSFDGNECLYAVGGNACYRASVLSALGGFPAYSADDAALGTVARRAGWQFVYVPSAVVFHNNPAGWGGYARQVRKITRYQAELESPERGEVLRARARMLAGVGRRLARGDGAEAIVAATHTLAATVGAVDHWRRGQRRRRVGGSGGVSVSVALATFNGARYLWPQLASLARQTRLPTELVVCDDGSTDETWTILTEFQECAPFPVHLHRNGDRLGHTANFLRSAGLCTGELIAFCDQDDVWSPTKLARCVRALSRRDAASIVAHSADVVDAELHALGHREPDLRNRRIPGGRGVDIGHFLGFTLCFRREILSYLPQRYLPTYGLPEADWGHDHWVCFLARLGAGIETMEKPLVRYRQHGSNAYGARLESRAEQQLWRTQVAADPLHRRAADMGAKADLIARARHEGGLSPRARSAVALEHGYRRASELLMRRSALYAPTSSFRVRLAGATELLLSGGYGARTSGGLGGRALAKDSAILLIGRRSFSKAAPLMAGPRSIARARARAMND